MAQGRLGTATLVANTGTVIYTAPTNCLYMVVDIYALNSSTSADAALQLALSTTSTPSTDEYIEKGKVIAMNGGTYDATSVKLSPGEIVWAKSDVALSLRVSGYPVTKLNQA